MMNFTRAVLAGAALMLGGAVGVAQQAAASAPAAVAIEFFASGPDGPVFDLRADEITLKVNSRVRPLRSLRYVALPSADPAGVPVDAPLMLDPPYGTNVAESAGRWVTIVVDQDSIRPGAEKNALNAAVRFLNALGPRDRVLYVTMPHGGVKVDFTTDHQKVVAALRRFVGRASAESTEQERSCQSRLVLKGMRDVLRDLAPLEGPKIVVLLSSGVLNPRRDAPALAPPGPCEIRLSEYHELRTAAAQARGYVFVVQPDEQHVESARNAFTDATLSRFSAADKDRAGLESVAGATAGEFFRIVGPDDNALPSVARATAGYYVLTFDPDDSERNGFANRVDLNVARHGVRVRTRPEVVIPRPSPVKAPSDPRDMLTDGILYRALPLRLVAYSSAGGGDKLRIMAVVDPVERDVRLTSAVFGLIDQRDKLIARWTANARELSRMPLITAGEAAPGAYRLRVAAIDAAGRSGTVETEVLVRLAEAGALQMSAMALGTSRDGDFVPKLIFGNDQTAVTFFEIYGSSSSESLTARVELAAGPDDRAMSTAVTRIVNASETRRMVVGALPIAQLPPGDYIVRAIVSLDGRPVGRVTRTLRKAVAGS